MKREPDLNIYSIADIVRSLAGLDQNPYYVRLARMMDLVASGQLQLLSDVSSVIAELGAGAHPQHYARTLEHLLSQEPVGQMYWVDSSPHVIRIAQDNLQGSMLFVHALVFATQDMMEFLEMLPNESLSMALMKYTLNFVPTDKLEYFFELLFSKLKSPGRFVATVSNAGGELVSHSRHVRYTYTGREIPEGTPVQLKPGDEYGINFFKDPAKPTAGYLGEVRLYYHALPTLMGWARKLGFSFAFQDWKFFTGERPQCCGDFNAPFLVMGKP